MVARAKCYQCVAKLYSRLYTLRSRGHAPFSDHNRVSSKFVLLGHHYALLAEQALGLPYVVPGSQC